MEPYFFSKPLQTTQPIRMQAQQKILPATGQKGTHPMRMHDNNTTCNRGNQNASLPDTAAQPISIQLLQTQQKPRVAEERHNAEKHSLLLVNVAKRITKEMFRLFFLIVLIVFSHRVKFTKTFRRWPSGYVIGMCQHCHEMYLT